MITIMISLPYSGNGPSFIQLNHVTSENEHHDFAPSSWLPWAPSWKHGFCGWIIDPG